MNTLLGIFQWALAILSVGGTIALISWIAMMFFKKDQPK
jgi:hypothetical protein